MNVCQIVMGAEAASYHHIILGKKTPQFQKKRSFIIKQEKTKGFPPLLTKTKKGFPPLLQNASH